MYQNVTQQLSDQQKRMDKTYHDAIEANFSHEQMNPLNCILINSNIIQKRFLALTSNPASSDPKTNEDTLRMMLAIEQCSKGLWYFNQNQIQKMKIRKGEFGKRETSSNQLVKHLEHVVFPFQLQLLKK